MLEKRINGEIELFLEPLEFENAFGTPEKLGNISWDAHMFYDKINEYKSDDVPFYMSVKAIEMVLGKGSKNHFYREKLISLSRLTQ